MSESKNVGIVGYRYYQNWKEFSNFLNNNLPEKCTIVSGGCIGTDQMAERYAKEMGLNTIIFLPQGDSQDRFKNRNRKIVNMSDYLIAFVSKKSKGTFQTIRMAGEKGIKVLIYNID